MVDGRIVSGKVFEPYSVGLRKVLGAPFGFPYQLDTAFFYFKQVVETQMLPAYRLGR